MGGFSRRMAACPAVTRACLGSSDATTAELRRIRVDSRARGFGIGREMLAFAADVAPQDGRARMALSACELEQAAISLCRKFGVSVHKSFAGSDPSAHLAVGFDGFSLKRIYDEASACRAIALFDDGPYSWPSG